MRELLLEEREIPRLKLGQHALTQSRIGDEITKVLVRALGEGAAGFELVAQLSPELRHPCLNLIEQAASRMRKTGVDEEVAGHRVRAECADGRQEWTCTTMTNEDDTAIRRQRF